MSHLGRYDLTRLKEVLLLIIANDAPLGAECSDHPLAGGWEGFRECHVGGDVLLIYKLVDDTITFTRAGTQAELFE
ncbi:MAG: type II toxin-antitoxin system YafQ family toxin [Burkholderiales bacterium]|nr:type II toxin-antitoxin system YafQ family toxin [Burkholderiales bacterium]